MCLNSPMNMIIKNGVYKDAEVKPKARRGLIIIVMKSNQKKPELKKAVMWAGLFVTLASAALIALELTKPADHPALLVHSHVELAYYLNGDRIIVPAGIGIYEELWNNHDLDQYGAAGLSPLHTHLMDGTIHVESNDARPYTFGEFLDIWGLDLDGKQVSLCIQGDSGCDPVSDYRGHVLTDGHELRLEVNS